MASNYWTFTQQLRQSGETSLPVPKFLKRPHCFANIGVNPRVSSEGYISAEVRNNPTQPSLTSISLRSFLQPTIPSRSPPPSPHALYFTDLPLTLFKHPITNSRAFLLYKRRFFSNFWRLPPLFPWILPLPDSSQTPDSSIETLDPINKVLFSLSFC